MRVGSTSYYYTKDHLSSHSRVNRQRLIAINYTDTGNRTEIAYDGLGRMKAIGIIDTDIEFSAVIQPPNTDYTPFTSDPLSLVGGEYILSFEGLNPNGGGNTAFVDAVTLNDTLVGNGSFEVPDLDRGSRGRV
jgi:YD repeat-containing protein